MSLDWYIPVCFSQKLQDEIKALVNGGHVSEAQRLIFNELTKQQEQKIMGEVLPPGAEPVETVVEDVRAAAEAQLAKEAEMNAVEPQPLSFFEFLKLLRAESPIVSFNCEPTEDGHMYLLAQVFNETEPKVAEDGSKWKNFESEVTGQFYVTPEGQVIPVNAPGPLKSEASVQ